MNYVITHCVNKYFLEHTLLFKVYIFFIDNLDAEVTKIVCDLDKSNKFINFKSFRACILVTVLFIILTYQCVRLTA